MSAPNFNPKNMAGAPSPRMPACESRILIRLASCSDFGCKGRARAGAAEANILEKLAGFLVSAAASARLRNSGFFSSSSRSSERGLAAANRFSSHQAKDANIPNSATGTSISMLKLVGMTGYTLMLTILRMTSAPSNCITRPPTSICRPIGSVNSGIT